MRLPPLAPAHVRKRIVDLAKERKPPLAIAAEIGGGITANYVTSIISKARKNGHVIPYAVRGYETFPVQRVAPATAELTLKLQPAVMRYFEHAVMRRGRVAERIVAEVITLIFEDKLVDAILDDGDVLSS